MPLEKSPSFDAMQDQITNKLYRFLAVFENTRLYPGSNFGSIVAELRKSHTTPIDLMLAQLARDVEVLDDKNYVAAIQAITSLTCNKLGSQPILAQAVLQFMNSYLDMDMETKKVLDHNIIPLSIDHGEGTVSAAAND